MNYLLSMDNNTDPVLMLRSMCEQSTQSAVAERLGVAIGYVSDVINYRRAPGKKLLTALGLRRVITHEKMQKTSV